MLSFVVLLFHLVRLDLVVRSTVFLPHSAAKEMAILSNLQHAKDNIKLYLFLFLLKL